MNLKTLRAWLAKNKKAVLGTAGVGVAGVALYAKHKGTTTTGTVTPATTDAATVAADQGLTGTVPTYGGDTGASGSGLDSTISSDLDAEVTTLQNLLDAQTASQSTLGQISSTVTTVAKNTAPTKPKPTSAGKYVVAYDPKNNTYYGVTDKNVDVLHAAGVARHLGAGSQLIQVAARPVPLSARKPAPKKAAPKPRPKRKAK